MTYSERKVSTWIGHDTVGTCWRETPNPVSDQGEFPTEIDLWNNLWKCDSQVNQENRAIQKPEEETVPPRMVKTLQKTSKNRKVNLQLTTWSLPMLLES